MLKKITCFVGMGISVLLLTCFRSITAFAESDYNAEYTYTILHDNTVSITGYTGSGGDITIPSFIDGYTVTEIGYEAFAGCISITSVTIPDSVTTIGIYTFAHCTNLVSVSIGSGITEIGEGTFYNCTSLTSITIPGNVEVIGREAFRDCSNLISVVISDGVMKIGEYAFLNCICLTEVYMPYSIENIFSYPMPAFYGCENLTMYCPPSSYAASYARGHNINYYPCPSGEVHKDGIIYGIFNEEGIVSVIGYNEYYGGGVYDPPEEVTIYSTLQDDLIGDNTTVRSIWEYALYNCTNLTSVIISDGIEEIGDKAFYGCENLTSVVIPESVAIIGEDAFENCPNLVIYGKSGSYAEQYAHEHLLKFEIYEDKKTGSMIVIIIAIAVVLITAAGLGVVLEKRSHAVVVHSTESSPLSVVNFCSFCGKKVDSGAAFCKYCGAKINTQ